jgi:Tfp pilus assembly major pilin PilA
LRYQSNGIGFLEELHVVNNKIETKLTSINNSSSRNNNNKNFVNNNTDQNIENSSITTTATKTKIIIIEEKNQDKSYSKQIDYESSLPKAIFEVGQIIKHKKFNYRGVISCLYISLHDCVCLLM